MSRIQDAGHEPFVLPKSECIILCLPYFTIVSIFFYIISVCSTIFYYILLYDTMAPSKRVKKQHRGPENHEAIVLNPKAPLLNFSACVAGQRRTSDAPLD